MTASGRVSLSLLPAARSARSAPALANVLSRAQARAGLYERLLADWPAMVEFAQRDAAAIEALWYERGAQGS